MHIIDRRLNPKGKSLSNRQRFLRRARSYVKKAVDEGLKKHKITDSNLKGNVKIPADSLLEPVFRPDYNTGRQGRVLPGNKDFTVGDKIQRPPQGGGEGESEASADGEGEDEFQFMLTREEFLDIFFEDLKLPDMVKKKLKSEETNDLLRAGYKRHGAQSQIDLRRTMRSSLARRISLRRPSSKEIAALEDEMAQLEDKNKLSEGNKNRQEFLREKLVKLKKRRYNVPYIDPIDVRYKNFVPVKRPNSKAVMFCLMDVSGSMGETHKDLAKRFFLLLKLFLDRQYEYTDIVFIRHTHQASEVDEDTFFYSRETGGTIVSTALRAMEQVVRDRYPVSDWNIYAAQASDGDNFVSDNEECANCLSSVILPMCQYFAYVEIWAEHEAQLFTSKSNETNLWRTYDEVRASNKDFAMTKVSKAGDIYPVFHDLFAREEM